MNKEKLIDTIKELQDPNLLEDIYRLLKLDADDSVFVTNTDQKSRIIIAQNEIVNQHTINSEKANQEIDEWLNE